MLKLLDPVSVIFVFFNEDGRFFVVELLEIVEHDCYREIQQKVTAHDNKGDEEHRREEEAVAVLHHLHDLGPALQRRALEYC